MKKMCRRAKMLLKILIITFNNLIIKEMCISKGIKFASVFSASRILTYTCCSEPHIDTYGFENIRIETCLNINCRKRGDKIQFNFH
jgi:hypothetical protein